MKVFKIILICFLIVSCNEGTKSSKTILKTDHTEEKLFTKSQLEQNNYSFTRLSKVNFGKSIKVTGIIDVPPHYKALVSTYKAGYISKAPLIIGDKVTKGQLLVSLKNPEYVELQQNYLEVSEQLVFLKAEFDRQQTLFKENITSKKNYLKAQANYKSNLAHYNGLKTTLQMLNINPKQVEAGNITPTINIYAPIDGFVTGIHISNGSYASENDIIMELINTEHLHLELNVFEKDILNVKPGQYIEFTIPEASSEVFKAKVHLVGTTVDETTRRIKVHAHVTNDTNFIVGMYASAKILLSDDIVYALPNEAIIQNEEGTFVLQLVPLKNDQYTFKKTKVTVGKNTSTHTEVLNSEVFLDAKILVEPTDEF